MVGRYIVNDAVKSGDCLVTSDNFSGVFERLENFVEQLVGHIRHRIQKQKILDYIKGLLSDVERKNVESISYFHGYDRGYDRQWLQFFIGQVEWDDEIILDKLVKKIDNEIGDVEMLVGSRWRDDTNKPRCDYYLSYNKSAPVELEEYARVIKQAYRIEECFHRAKGECGLADYQVRNWRGWHHVAISMLCLWFLTEELMYQKKTSSITIQQVRECLTNMLVNERLQTCKQDEYASYRSTQWIYRTKIARKIAQKKQNPQNK